MKNEKIFVDTNIFLRYLTNDDITLANKIEKIFKKAFSGKLSLVTNAFVIAEVIWVLESYYGLSKEEVEAMTSKIINTRGIEIKDAHLLLKAIDLYVSKNIDFIDAYNAVYMKEHNLVRVLTLDKKHFSRIEDIDIVEF
jgi:predicted nucleic-acid-binding protein